MNGRIIAQHCAALVAVSAFAAAFGGCGKTPPRDSLTSAYAKLSSRPCALRLAEMPHRPLNERTRGTPTTSDYALKSAANDILAEPEKHPLHRVALAQLLTRNYMAAVENFAKAAERQPGNSAIWNDLAVAQHELADRTGDPRFLVSALASADRALEQGGGAVAAFNRAAVLDSLALRDPAADAWKRFIDLDATSDWTAEARTRLRVAEAPTAFARWKEALPDLERAIARRDAQTVDRLVRAFPQYARTWAESDHLSRWGDAILAGDGARAARMLDFARAVGLQLVQVNGETLLRDVVRVIDTATERVDLAQAHVDYRAARKLIESRRPSEAIELLESVEHRFGALNSPMALLARCYRAAAVFDTRDAAAARRLIDAVAPASGYEALRGHLLWERARIASRTGNHYAALTHASRAFAIFDGLGEPENAARNRSEAASDLVMLGRPSDAWNLRIEALHDAARTGRPGTVEAVLHGGARDEMVDGRLEEARSLFNVMSALPSASPQLKFDAMLWRTFLDIRSLRERDHEHAIRALRAAAAVVPDVLRADAEDDLQFAEALLVGKSDPRRAIELLDVSIAFRRRAGRASRVAAALAERGRLRRLTKDAAGAERDLHEALSLIETERQTVATLALRDSFFDTAGHVCRELAGIHVARNDAEAAFDSVERCRARALLDVTATDGAALVLKAREIQREIPLDTTLLMYAEVGDEVAIFALRGDAIALRTVPAPASEYAALIAPVEEFLGRRSKLVIVPDDAIAHIPFATLRPLSGTSGRYLIDTHELTFAFSASTWALGEKQRADARDVLAVGDPAFAGERHPQLRRLPGAETEARYVAKLHSRSMLLLSNAATESRVIAAAASADVIHVASHALMNEHDARTSALLLAPDRDGDGMLTVSEITQLKLPRSPLVVLAGCTTARQGGGRGSISSIASAFVAAGARGVVASLSEIDDSASLYFSTALHRHLRDGKPAAAAVRATQLEMATSADPRLQRPESWGGFQFYGVE